MINDIDWAQLAARFCTKLESGYVYSSKDAEKVIAELLGPQVIKSAVDEYVYNSAGIGAELARLFLNQVKSDYAVDYVYSIYKKESNADWQVSAVELFRYIVTRKSLAYYPELIQDPNPQIRRWATFTIDQLIFQGIVPAEELQAEVKALEQLNPELYIQLMSADDAS